MELEPPFDPYFAMTPFGPARTFPTREGWTLKVGVQKGTARVIIRIVEFRAHNREFTLDPKVAKDVAAFMSDLADWCIVIA